MHHSSMLDPGLTAELRPNADRIGCRARDVGRSVSLLVTLTRGPAVLVCLANHGATGVVVLFAKVERVDATATPMDQRVAQCRGERVVAAPDEDRISGVGVDLDPELDRRRVILILGPSYVREDTLSRVLEERFKVGLVHEPTE